jgi:hypothetical protein
MVFDTKVLKEAIDEIDQLVGEGFRKKDTKRLLMLVSRMQWQLGALVSDIAEEMHSHGELKHT